MNRDKKATRGTIPRAYGPAVPAALRRKSQCRSFGQDRKVRTALDSELSSTYQAGVPSSSARCASFFRFCLISLFPVTTEECSGVSASTAVVLYTSAARPCLSASRLVHRLCGYARCFCQGKSANSLVALIISSLAVSRYVNLAVLCAQ